MTSNKKNILRGRLDMRVFISTLLFGIVGAVLSSANVTCSSWQFWVVVACMAGLKFCGHF